MAYFISTPSEKKALNYLPWKLPLKVRDEFAILDWYREEDRAEVYAMMKQVVDEGLTYPQSEMDDNHFNQYYLSHDCFVARSSVNNVVLGSFYVKPNFPGRSSHICNGGFLVQVDQRQKGVGECLFKAYLRIARDLGYEGSFFNLVYACNTASLKICRRLGFSEIGIVPKAGKLKNIGYCDAVQFYYDLTTLNDSGEPAWGWPPQ